MDLREGPSALRHIRGSGGVTPRQRDFVNEYVRNGGCGARAWRKVYHSDYSHPNSPSHLAYMALRRPAVRQYLERKLARMVTRAQITEDKMLTQYQRAIDMAESQGKCADMISGTTAQAKLVGLLRDRIEAGPPGSFEGLENISDVLQRLTEVIGPEATQKIGVALGVLPVIEPAVQSPAPVQPTSEQTIALLASDSPSDAVN